MDNKVKAIIGVAILAVGVIGFNAVSKELKKDPVVTGIEAEFVGEVARGDVYKKDVFRPRRNGFWKTCKIKQFLF